MSILLTIFDLSSRIFGTSDTKVYKISPPLQKKSEIFSIGYKQFFIFPSVFRSVRPMRPILFDHHRAVVCFSLSMRFRALCRSEFPSLRRFCFFVLRKLRSESFFRPEACGAIFRNSVFFDPSLLKKCAPRVNDSISTDYFLRSSVLAYMWAEMGSVVDQKYPQSHGQKRLGQHFFMQSIRYITYC